MDKQLNIFEVYVGKISQVSIDGTEGFIKINTNRLDKLTQDRFVFSENFKVSLNKVYLCYFKNNLFSSLINSNKVKLIELNYDVFCFKVLFKELYYQKDCHDIKEVLLNFIDNLDYDAKKDKHIEACIHALSYTLDFIKSKNQLPKNLFIDLYNKGFSYQDLKKFISYLLSYKTTDRDLLDKQNILNISFIDSLPSILDDLSFENIDKNLTQICFIKSPVNASCVDAIFTKVKELPLDNNNLQILSYLSIAKYYQQKSNLNIFDYLKDLSVENIKLFFTKFILSIKDLNNKDELVKLSVDCLLKSRISRDDLKKSLLCLNILALIALVKDVINYDTLDKDRIEMSFSCFYLLDLKDAQSFLETLAKQDLSLLNSVLSFISQDTNKEQNLDFLKNVVSSLDKSMQDLIAKNLDNDLVFSIVNKDSLSKNTLDSLKVDKICSCLNKLVSYEDVDLALCSDLLFNKDNIIYINKAIYLKNDECVQCLLYLSRFYTQKEGFSFLYKNINNLNTDTFNNLIKIILNLKDDLDFFKDLIKSFYQTKSLKNRFITLLIIKSKHKLDLIAYNRELATQEKDLFLNGLSSLYVDNLATFLKAIKDSSNFEDLMDYFCINAEFLDNFILYIKDLDEDKQKSFINKLSSSLLNKIVSNNKASFILEYFTDTVLKEKIENFIKQDSVDEETGSFIYNFIYDKQNTEQANCLKQLIKTKKIDVKNFAYEYDILLTLSLFYKDKKISAVESVNLNISRVLRFFIKYLNFIEKYVDKNLAIEDLFSFVEKYAQGKDRSKYQAALKLSAIICDCKTLPHYFKQKNLMYFYFIKRDIVIKFLNTLATKDSNYVEHLIHNLCLFEQNRKYLISFLSKVQDKSFLYKLDRRLLSDLNTNNDIDFILNTKSIEEHIREFVVLDDMQSRDLLHKELFTQDYDLDYLLNQKLFTKDSTQDYDFRYLLNIYNKQDASVAKALIYISYLMLHKDKKDIKFLYSLSFNELNILIQKFRELISYSDNKNVYLKSFIDLFIEDNQEIGLYIVDKLILDEFIDLNKDFCADDLLKRALLLFHSTDIGPAQNYIRSLSLENKDYVNKIISYILKNSENIDYLCRIIDSITEDDVIYDLSFKLNNNNLEALSASRLKSFVDLRSLINKLESFIKDEDNVVLDDVKEILSTESSLLDSIISNFELSNILKSILSVLHSANEKHSQFYFIYKLSHQDLIIFIKKLKELLSIHTDKDKIINVFIEVFTRNLDNNKLKDKASFIVNNFVLDLVLDFNIQDEDKIKNALALFFTLDKDRALNYLINLNQRDDKNTDTILNYILSYTNNLNYLDTILSSLDKKDLSTFIFKLKDTTIDNLLSNFSNLKANLQHLVTLKQINNFMLNSSSTYLNDIRESLFDNTLDKEIIAYIKADLNILTTTLLELLEAIESKDYDKIKILYNLPTSSLSIFIDRFNLIIKEHNFRDNFIKVILYICTRDLESSLEDSAQKSALYIVNSIILHEIIDVDVLYLQEEGVYRNRAFSIFYEIDKQKAIDFLLNIDSLDVLNDIVSSICAYDKSRLYLASLIFKDLQKSDREHLLLNINSSLIAKFIDKELCSDVDYNNFFKRYIEESVHKSFIFVYFDVKEGKLCNISISSGSEGSFNIDATMIKEGALDPLYTILNGTKNIISYKLKSYINNETFKDLIDYTYFKDNNIVDLAYLYALNNIDNDNEPYINKIESNNVSASYIIETLYYAFLYELNKALSLNNKVFFTLFNNSIEEIFSFIKKDHNLLESIYRDNFKDFRRDNNNIYNFNNLDFSSYDLVCSDLNLLLSIAKEHDISLKTSLCTDYLYLNKEIEYDEQDKLLLDYFASCNKTALYISLNSYLKERLKKYFSPKTKESTTYFVDFDTLVAGDYSKSKVLILSTESKISLYTKDFNIDNTTPAFISFVKEHNYEYLTSKELDVATALTLCTDTSFISLVNTYKDFCHLTLFKGDLNCKLSLSIDLKNYFKSINNELEYRCIDYYEDYSNRPLNIVKLYNENLENLNDLYIGERNYAYYYLYKAKILCDLYKDLDKSLVYVIDEPIDSLLIEYLDLVFAEDKESDVNLFSTLDTFSHAIITEHKKNCLLVIFKDDLSLCLTKFKNKELVYVIDSLYCKSLDNKSSNQDLYKKSLQDFYTKALGSLQKLVYSRTDKALVYIADPYLDKDFVNLDLPYLKFKHLSLFTSQESFNLYIEEHKEYLDELYKDSRALDNISFSYAEKLSYIEEKLLNNNKLRDEQKDILKVVLDESDKRDLFISLKTGGGKSVLFQGPALLSSLLEKKLTIVIVPIKALMLDQVTALHEKGFVSSVDYLNSDRDASEVSTILQNIALSKINLLFVSPERFRSERFVSVLEQRLKRDNGLAYLVFDEAHCISQWGHSFRIEYLSILNKVKEIKDSYKDTKLLFLSATATSEVIAQISKEISYDLLRLGINLETDDPTAKHLDRSFHCLDKSDLNSFLSESIKDFYNKNEQRKKESNIIVFCRRRIDTEDLSNHFNSYFEQDKDFNFIKCDYFHSNMSIERKDEVFLLFKDSTVRVLFATSAFGIGMDLPNIHKVIAINPPLTIEEYLQEVGRAGRDVKLASHLGFDEEHPIENVCIFYKDYFKKCRDKLLDKSINILTMSDIQRLIYSQAEALGHDLSFYKDTILALPKPMLLKSSLSDNGFHTILYYLEKMKRLSVKYRYASYMAIKVKALKTTDSSLDLIFEAIKQDLKRTYAKYIDASSLDQSLISLGSVFINLSSLQRICSLTRSELLNSLVLLAQDDCIELLHFIEAQKSDLLSYIQYEGNTLTLDLYLKALYEIFGIFIKNNIEREDLVFEDLDKEHMAKFRYIEAKDNCKYVQFTLPINKESKDFSFIFENEIQSIENFTSIKIIIKAFLSYLKREGFIDYNYTYTDKSFNFALAIDKEKEDQISSFISRTLEQIKKFVTCYLDNVANTSLCSLRLDVLLSKEYFSYNYDSFKHIKKLCIDLNLFKSIEDDPYSTLINTTDFSSLLVLESIEAYQNLSSEQNKQYSALINNDIDVLSNFSLVKDLTRLRFFVLEFMCKNLDFKIRQNQNTFLNNYFKCKDIGDYVNLLESSSYDDEELKQYLTAITEEVLKEKEELLNIEQRAIYDLPINTHINVLAGPGSGKTHLLVLRCAKLIYKLGLKPQNILVLAYNRAVVIELRRRLNEIFASLGLSNIANKLNVYNYHQLAKKLCLEDLVDKDVSLYESILLNKLRSDPNLIKDKLGDIKCILIDEFQDITQNRLDSIFLFLDIYKDCYLFTIGDVNQSIYGYDKYADSNKLHSSQYSLLDPMYYYEVLETKLQNLHQMTLSINYRSYKPILDLASELINNSHTVEPCPENKDSVYAQDAILIKDINNTDLMEKSIFNSFVFIKDLILNKKRHDLKNVAILFRTNSEVFRALSYVKQLLKHENHQDLKANIIVQHKAQREYLYLREFYDFYNYLLSIKNKKYRFNDFKDFLYMIFKKAFVHNGYDAQYVDYAYSVALYCLDEIESNTSKSDFIVEDFVNLYYDIALYDEEAILNIYKSYKKDHLIKDDKDIDIILSTIHKVKGLEYDVVIIPPSTANLPLTKVDESLTQDFLAEERRLYYVAYTRAKKILHVYRDKRERALLANQVFKDDKVQNYYYEREEGLDKYYINYLVRHHNIVDLINKKAIKRGDFVSICNEGSYYLIKHTKENITLGALSKKSSIVQKMQLNGIKKINKLMISDIFVWRGLDSKRSDEKNNTSYFRDWITNNLNEDSIIYIVTIAGVGFVA